FMRGDGALVSFIERELFCSTREKKIAAVTPAIDFFRQKNCDTIILGCTHFTHVANEIAEAAGKDICVVDSRDGVANQALRVLQDNQHEQKKSLSQQSAGNLGLSEMKFFVTRLASESEKREYEILCKHYGILFGGMA
ncbi:MAG: glutamate racemase, partial [Treponemataceae bacterium]|nr:glutamate racemase [Treponemataceae bacterium]